MSLTILLPTVWRPTLPTALESIGNQTVPVDEVIVRHDAQRIGTSRMLRRMLTQVQTTWVGFCADDDEMDAHYHEWLLEESGEMDMVIFRMDYPNGLVLPDDGVGVEDLRHGRVGASYAVRTDVARAVGFPDEDSNNEDWLQIAEARARGCRITISDRVAYHLRPHERCQS